MGFWTSKFFQRDGSLLGFRFGPVRGDVRWFWYRKSGIQNCKRGFERTARRAQKHHWTSRKVVRGNRHGREVGAKNFHGARESFSPCAGTILQGVFHQNHRKTEKSRRRSLGPESRSCAGSNPATDEISENFEKCQNH